MNELAAAVIVPLADPSNLDVLTSWCVGLLRVTAAVTVLVAAWLVDALRSGRILLD